jgi:uncharacterized protein involved in exopolysaccharide biosynthesis
MTEPFDPIRYIRYLKSRWREIAASAALAIALAIVVSLLLPTRYTATARIVIEPPAGADVRSSTAVSPIYLESLKTYEEFASSDSLFQKAVQHFQLTGGPIESLKRRVLKVEIVRNTRIMEISATLGDARKAQALAKFLADGTVEMNRASSSDSDEEVISGLEQQERDARANLEQTEAAWSAAISQEPISALENAIEQSAMRRSTIEEQIQSEQVAIAGSDEHKTAGDLSNSRARVAEMQKELVELDRQTADRERVLGARQAHRDQLSSNREAGQTALATVEGRLRDARQQRGSRVERLQVIDPGIVPERPSSPNLPLNAVVALFVGLLLPILYFTLRFSLEERHDTWDRTPYRSPVRTRDE